MMDVQSMTDDAFCLYQARQWAAARYRSNGHNTFADRVEIGLEDQSSQVRLGRFFFEPSLPLSPAFIIAWDAVASFTANTAN